MDCGGKTSHQEEKQPSSIEVCGNPQSSSIPSNHEARLVDANESADLNAELDLHSI